jgi:hypothetical protein
MLSLSDDEMRIILDSAQPLAPQDRTPFLEAVAAELAKYRELGPGVVSRTCRELLDQALAEQARARASPVKSLACAGSMKGVKMITVARSSFSQRREGPHRFSEKRRRTFESTLKSIATAE